MKEGGKGGEGRTRGKKGEGREEKEGRKKEETRIECRDWRQVILLLKNGLHNDVAGDV